MLKLDYSTADKAVRDILDTPTIGPIIIQSSQQKALRLNQKNDNDSSLYAASCMLGLQVHPNQIKLPEQLNNKVQAYINIPSGALDEGKSQQNALTLHLFFVTDAPQIKESVCMALACHHKAGRLLTEKFHKVDNGFDKIDKNNVIITGSPQKILGYLNFIKTNAFTQAVERELEPLTTPSDAPPPNSPASY